METSSGVVTITDCTHDGEDYTCYRDFEGTEGDGLRIVRVTVIDDAGNSASTQKQVDCDFIAPSVAASSVSPHINRNIIYHVSFNEELGMQPDFSTSPEGPYWGYSVSHTENQYTFTGEVTTMIPPVSPEDEPTAYTMSNGEYFPYLKSCDLVGNCSYWGSNDLMTFEIDWAVPEIAQLTIQGGLTRSNGMHVFNSYERNDEIWISFDVTDDYGSDNVKVTLETPGSSNLYEISCVISGNSYFCPQQMVGNGSGSGPVPGYEIPCIESGIGRVVVTAEDDAGNITSDSAYIETDLDAPEALTETINTTLAKLDDEIILQVTYNEPVDANFKTPILTASSSDGATILFDLLSAQDETLTFKHKVEVGDSDEYTLSVSDVSDMLKNCQNTYQLIKSFEADADAPVITPIEISGGLTLENGMHRFSADPNYYLMQVLFSVSDAYGEAEIVVEMDSDLGTVVFGQGTGGAYQHYFAGSEGSGKHTVFVTATDEAGNSDQDEIEIECDFDMPVIEDSHYTPDPAKLASMIKYYISTDEEIDLATSDLALTSDLNAWSNYSGSGNKFNWTRTSGVIAGEHGSHGVTINKLCDLVGNCDEDVLASPVEVDAQPADVQNLKVCFDDGTSDPCAVEDETFSAQIDYNLMKISFSLSQAADTLVTMVGDDDLICEADSLNYVCSYTVVDANNGTNPRMVTELVSVTSIDAAGNTDFASQPVTFDFQPPFQIGTALLERCDGYTPARVEQDELWVKNGDQCFMGDKEICQYKGPICPYKFNGHNYAPLRVSFALSEDAEIVGIVVAGGGIFQVGSTSTGRYKIAYYADFNNGPGTWPVVAHMVDELGNEDSFDIATLRFDYDQPKPPDVNTEDSVVYHRVLWGSDATDGETKIWVEGQAEAVENYEEIWQRGLVKVYKPSPQVLLAEGETKSDGYFEAIEFGADLLEVNVSYLDPAGNESEPANVRDVSWTATMGYKIPYSVYDNPNVFKTAPYFYEDRLAQDDTSIKEPSSYDLQKLNKADSDTMIKAAEQDWLELTPKGDNPTARERHAMAYDSARGKVVLFGGNNSSGCGEGAGDYCAWIWEWDGARWTNVTPEGDNPTARERHALAYDSARGKVLLFGGYNISDCGEGASYYCAWTWEWDRAADKTGAGIFEAKFVEAQATDASIQSMQVNIYAGGSAYSNADEDGSILHVWDSHPGYWRELDVNLNDVDNPDLLTYSTDDANEIRRMMFGDNLSLNFAVTPAYPNGTGVKLSEVAVDYVETTVKYRLPAAE